MSTPARTPVRAGGAAAGSARGAAAGRAGHIPEGHADVPAGTEDPIPGVHVWSLDGPDPEATAPVAVLHVGPLAATERAGRDAVSLSQADAAWLFPGLDVDEVIDLGPSLVAVATPEGTRLGTRRERWAVSEADTGRIAGGRLTGAASDGATAARSERRPGANGGPPRTVVTVGSGRASARSLR